MVISSSRTSLPELNEMCLAAVGHVIENARYAELGIPKLAIPLIEHNWTHGAPSLLEALAKSVGQAKKKRRAA